MNADNMLDIDLEDGKAGLSKEAFRIPHQSASVSQQSNKESSRVSAGGATIDSGTGQPKTLRNKRKTKTN